VCVCVRIESQPELEELSVGDKIIEVNGVSVQDQHLDEITSLLEDTRRHLQIMVERDPSPLRGARRSYPSDTDSDTERSSSSSSLPSPDCLDVDGTRVQLRPKDVINTHRSASLWKCLLFKLEICQMPRAGKICFIYLMTTNICNTSRC